MGEHTFDDIDGAAGSLEAMVNEVDVATLTGEGATRLVRRLVTAERVLAACRARAAARAAEANQWRQAGERSAASWVARLTGTTLGQAAAELEATAKLADLPATDAARRAGRISDLQTREITSAATADRAAEAELLRRAEIDDAAAFKRRCAEVRAAAERDEAAARERIRRARRFRSWTDAEGAFCFAGRGLPEEGAALLAAMKRYQDRAFHAARRRGEREGSEAYAYDGLMAMARHDAHHRCDPMERATATSSTASGADSSGGGGTDAAPGDVAVNGAGCRLLGMWESARTDGTSSAAGAHPRAGTRATPMPRDAGTATTSINAHAPGTTATKAADPHLATTTRATTTRATTTRATAETAARSGPSSADATRDEILAECFRPGPRAKLVVRIDHTALVRGHTVAGEVCEIVGIGPVPVATARELARDAFLTAAVMDGVDVSKVVHLGRSATAHQRTALEARGMACAVPGCGYVHGLEIDHVDGWAITRRTHIDQLDWLCHFHHGQKTHKSWRLAGPPGNRTWHPPGSADSDIG